MKARRKVLWIATRRGQPVYSVMRTTRKMAWISLMRRIPVRRGDGMVEYNATRADLQRVGYNVVKGVFSWPL